MFIYLLFYRFYNLCTGKRHIVFYSMLNGIYSSGNFDGDFLLLSLPLLSDAAVSRICLFTQINKPFLHILDNVQNAYLTLNIHGSAN